MWQINGQIVPIALIAASKCSIQKITTSLAGTQLPVYNWGHSYQSTGNIATSLSGDRGYSYQEYSYQSTKDIATSLLRT